MRKLTAAAALTALALAGCDGTIVDGDEPPIPEYTSPATVLKAVQISFNQRNFSYLVASLSEGFVFYFDPDDVGQYPPGGGNYKIPESWTYDEFWKAAHNMLQMAYSISFFVRVESLRQPAENEATYKAPDVKLSLLVMVDETNGYFIDGRYCDFAFERYESEKGERLWRLTGWWDHTAEFYDGGAAASPATLGKILALFYE
jgi:hypothetical protein